jgi:hypothetical protein
MTRRRHSKKLLEEYRKKILASSKDLHFYGIQASEDYLDNRLSNEQYIYIMDQIEEDVGRFLLLIQECKKFHQAINIKQLLAVTTEKPNRRRLQ